jgi:NAD(P)-dependent dehydrogenase (short-subunit alcohol dehydrogenase family)
VTERSREPVVVLAGPDAEALGMVARELEDAGRRAAVFVGDVTDPAARAALHEMLNELFPL